MDRRGRDQFVIRYGDETEVCWNDHQKQQAEQVSCHMSCVRLLERLCRPDRQQPTCAMLGWECLPGLCKAEEAC